VPRKIRRRLVDLLLRRLARGPNLIQIVVGPRQVGKTTALEQVIADWSGPSHYASADLPAPPTAEWIAAQWQVARSLQGRALLVLDEAQKVPRWSEIVKALSDEDRRSGARLRVVVLGSASLELRAGASESLAGRFEVHHCPHWSFSECRDAFAWNLDQWLYFGGYPGAARLVRSRQRWADYVRNSLIETVVSRDVLQVSPVAKPALLRQLFALACQAPAEIVAFNKMLGQLQDAGNTVTLAHYLELLSAAFLVTGLQRWTPGKLRARASSPKLIVWSNALITALAPTSLRQLRGRPELWGRLVENAVGASLLAGGMGHERRLSHLLLARGSGRGGFRGGGGTDRLRHRGQERPHASGSRPRRVPPSPSQLSCSDRRFRRRAADRILLAARRKLVWLAGLSLGRIQRSSRKRATKP
jgi:predicted AAA+ superfamily ATPase